MHDRVPVKLKLAISAAAYADRMQKTVTSRRQWMRVGMDKSSTRVGRRDVYRENCI